MEMTEKREVGCRFCSWFFDTEEEAKQHEP